MPSQLGNCPPQAPRQSAASGFAEFNLQLGLLAGWGTGSKGAFCSRLVAIVVPDVHVPHGRLNNNGALVAVKTCVQLQMLLGRRRNGCHARGPRHLVVSGRLSVTKGS